MITALALKSTAILVAALVIRILLGRSSAAYRMVLWNVTVGSLLILPLLMLSIPRWSIPQASVPMERITGTITDLTPPMASYMLPDAPAFPWDRLALLIWIAGAAVVLGRLVTGMIRVHYIGKSSAPLTDPGSIPLEAPRPLTLLVSDANLAPFAWGWLRPKIMLPRAAESWPRERLRMVLAHELIHVRRLDYLSQIAGSLACALYWFHPLVWYAAGQLARERELSCDDEVLNMGTDRTDYAEQLLAILRTLRSPSSLKAPVTGMAHAFEGRLTAILDANRPRMRPARGAVIIATCAVACLLLPFAAMRAPAQDAVTKFSGVVRDPSGAIIPHATLTLTEPKGHTTQAMSLTAADGTFSLNGVPAGTYTLEVTQPGFAPYSRRVTLPSEDPAPLTITLSVGGMKETVEVIGKSPVPRPQNVTPHRIRVGGNVQASRLLSKVQPVYPALAEAEGIEGTVLLQAIIGVDGHLLSLGIANQGANASLASAAMDAVRQWTYQPTLLNGAPVEVVTTIAVVFRLQP